MDTVIQAGSATVVAQTVTSLVKFGYPSLPSWAVMLVSVLAGIGASFLVALAAGDVLSSQVVAQNVLTGILAAATAAGISRADRAADQQREAAKLGAEV
jgi:hypothetical protein